MSGNGFRRVQILAAACLLLRATGVQGEYEILYSNPNLQDHLVSAECDPGDNSACGCSVADVEIAVLGDRGRVTSNVNAGNRWANAIGHWEFIESFPDGRPVSLGTYRYRGKVRLPLLPFPDVNQQENPEAAQMMVQLWDGRNELLQSDKQSVEATIYWNLNPWSPGSGEISVYQYPLELVGTGIAVAPDTLWHDFESIVNLRSKEWISVTIDGQVADLAGARLPERPHPEWGSEVAIGITQESLSAWSDAECSTVFTWATEYRDIEFAYLSGSGLEPRIPLAVGLNLISLVTRTGNDSIAAIAAGLEANLVCVAGFETPLINPNPPLAGGKLYDPALPDFINTLKLVDSRLGYWFRMSAPDTLVTGMGASKVATPTPALTVEPPRSPDGRLHPVPDFMGIWGTLVLDGRPAPKGTVVDVLDTEGNLAGTVECDRVGFYGFLPIYRDDPDTDVDEGAETGEELSVWVNGHMSGGRVQWTEFGDVVRLNLDVNAVPESSALLQNYPNPFNPGTTIHYVIAQEEHVVLSIWNLTGQLVRQLVRETQAPGHYSVIWDGRDEAGRLVANGVYLYRIRAGEFQASRKMVLIQ